MPVDAHQLQIVHYPAAVLRQRAEPVAEIDQSVRDVAARMLELMHEAPGVGLAAPQVGLPWRMFVANWTGESGQDYVFINPVMSNPSKQTEARDEGCLSLPEISGEINRPLGITIEALDENGEPFGFEGEGLAARVWQHEYDHLDGVLIIDKMSRIDRMANRRAIKDLEVRAGG